VAPKVYDYTRIFQRPESEPSREPRLRDFFEYDYEYDVLTLASAGRWSDAEWRKAESLEEHTRLFTGCLGSVIKSIGGLFSISKSDSPFLHPGMQGSIKMGRNVVGVCGVIHPLIREHCDLREPGFYAELDVRLLYKFMNKREGGSLSDFPKIARDMTFSVDAKEQAGRVLRLIHECQLSSLAEAFIVDDFTKPGEGFRRVTYRVVFQSSERTLTHDEVDAAMGELLENMRAKHGIVIPE
jgi:phenylalanyl-tRNA synthetase beta subunit